MSSLNENVFYILTGGIFYFLVAYELIMLGNGSYGEMGPYFSAAGYLMVAVAVIGGGIFALFAIDKL